MVAGGNTPLALYAEVARRGPALEGIEVFVLDEYVGVPLEHPDTCSNLLRSRVAEAWGIPPARFHALSSLDADAEAAILEHERKIEAAGASTSSSSASARTGTWDSTSREVRGTRARA